MAKVNVPFELEPWCKGCPNLEPVVTLRVVVNLEPHQLRQCSHMHTCRWAVASARNLDKGGDADG